MADRDVLAAESYIMNLEGFSKKAYVDASGQSIGFGHFIKRGEENLRGKTLSYDEAKDLLRKDIASFQSPWIERAHKMGLSQSQITSLTSFAYNTGGGAIKRILDKMEKGDTRGAGEIMNRYNQSYNPSTKQREYNPALAERRSEEVKTLTGEGPGIINYFGMVAKEIVWTAKGKIGKGKGTREVSDTIIGNDYESIASAIANVTARLGGAGEGISDETWRTRLRLEASGRWQAT